MKRGFVLPIAIALCLLMILIATVLANQSRTLTTFAFSTQSEALQAEASVWASAQMRLIMQGLAGDLSFSPAMQNPSQNYEGTFKGQPPNSEAKVEGQVSYLAGGDLSVPSSFETTKTAKGAKDVKVPPDHASVAMVCQFPGDPVSHKYFQMFSSHCPWGVLSEQGAVRMISGLTVNQRSADPVLDGAGYGNGTTISPMMTNVYGHTSVNVSQGINGRAYSSGAVSLGNTSGIKYQQWPNHIALPGNFTQQLNNFGSQVVNGTFGTDGGTLGAALKAMHEDCLHRNFVPVGVTLAENQAQVKAAGGPSAQLTSMGDAGLTGPPNPGDVKTINSPGNTDYDSSGTLTIGTSLVIPKGEKQQLNFPQINLPGTNHLLVEEDALLHIRGNVSLQQGHIILGKRATLVVDGNAQCSDLMLPYDDKNLGVCSTIVVRGELRLNTGVMSGQYSTQPVAPTAASNPFPPRLNLPYVIPGNPPVGGLATPDNRVAGNFTQAQQHCLSVVAQALAPYLRNVALINAHRNDVPGAFMLVNGPIAVTGGFNSKVFGTVYTNSTVTGPNTNFIGVVWAKGDINIGRFGYFPYYTHVHPRTFGANNVTLSAVDHHPIGYGKLP